MAVSDSLFGWFSLLLKKEEKSYYCFAAPSHIERQDDKVSFFMEVKENVSDLSSSSAEIKRIWSFLEEKLEENRQANYAYRFLAEVDLPHEESLVRKFSKDLTVKKICVLVSFREVKEDTLKDSILPLLAYAVASSLWQIFPNLCPGESFFDLISEETLNSKSSDPEGRKEAIRLFDFFEEVKKDHEEMEEKKGK